MPCPELKNYGERNKKLVELQSLIEGIYDRLRYPLYVRDGFEEDVRPATLINIKGDIQVCIMNLNIIIGYEEKTIHPITVKTLGLESLDKKIGPIFLFRLSQYMQLALIAMFQFRIENMITNILARLPVKVPWGYKEKVALLLKELSLDTDDNLKTMNILQNVRNSFHNNGIHNLAPMEVDIDGCTFSFITGQKVTCAGWRHIVVAIDAILKIVEQILNAKKVQKIEAPISDAYVKGL